MNRNIFMRRQIASNNKGIVHKNIDTVTEKKKPITVPELDSKSINKNKYNPDVMRDYEKIKDYKIGDINYTNKTWKGITGSELNFRPDCSENFLIPKNEEPITQIKSEFEQEFALREQEKIRIEEKNRIIKEKMMENVMQMVDEICDDDTNIDDIATFDDLKIQGTSTMEVEQEDYNKLLNDITNL